VLAPHPPRSRIAKTQEKTMAKGQQRSNKEKKKPKKEKVPVKKS
jgi:hypothetical protein